MRSQKSILTIAFAGVSLGLAGVAYAGGGGGGCNYGGQMADLESQQTLVQADAEDLKIDPKWLLLLEQQNDDIAEQPVPVIHN